MNILALDLGTTTGFALGTRGGAVHSGSQSFAPGKHDEPGQRWLKFRAFLAEFPKSAGEIDAIYYERVLRHTAVQAAHVYGGFEAMLQVWCAVNRVQLIGIPVTVIKKHWTGKGNAKKEEMIAEAERRGFRPKDDNQADALALLDLARAKEGV